MTEVNFLCVHKKLRNKRITPILLKELTRRNIHSLGIQQAIGASGDVFPTPVMTANFFLEVDPN